MFNLSDFKGYPEVSKAWGTEIWLTNRDEYCAKLMVLNGGFQCSLHRHLKKTETFFILQGLVEVQIGIDGHKELKGPGDPIHIPVGTWHRFGDPSTSDFSDVPVMLEVSSHHDDEDVERLEPSGPIL